MESGRGEESLSAPTGERIERQREKFSPPIDAALSFLVSPPSLSVFFSLRLSTPGTSPSPTRTPQFLPFRWIPPWRIRPQVNLSTD